MKQITNDELIATTEFLIKKYKEEVKPYSVQLLQSYISSFLHITSSEDEDVATASGWECLRAILIVLGSLSNAPDVYPMVEQLILYPISKFFVEDFIDYISDFLKIISRFICYSPCISDNLWSMFPIIAEACLTWAMEFLPGFFSSLFPLSSFSSPLLLSFSSLLFHLPFYLPFPSLSFFLPFHFICSLLAVSFSSLSSLFLRIFLCFLYFPRPSISLSPFSVQRRTTKRSTFMLFHLPPPLLYLPLFFPLPSPLLPPLLYLALFFPLPSPLPSPVALKLICYFFVQRFSLALII